MKMIRENGVNIPEKEWVDILKKCSPENFGLPEGYDKAILEMFRREVVQE